ncbi:MAG: tRNA uridine-5-carboxymethylaminomethyl(34) synthesis GTPase MnmE [Candidatus Melainabacteria bacterium]|jgi:tRNA modification GTPase|nr:tRNA uridine-5-carboxymethylaminomethyl(34) synthesis GTPase MnmE [Candidatus Melainabacteria bacterium]
MNTTFLDDTICAVSTAHGAGAIAIVRLAGNDAWSIAERLFTPQGFPHREGEPSLKSHTAQHGFIRDPKTADIIDEVVVIPYKGPNSYTGSDLIEINCHGGSVVTAEILNACLECGARLARAGEFTERAFLSGKIDLTQAEAVLDVIQAKTVRQRQLAVSAMAGGLGAKIKAVRMELLTLLTEIVAGIDFPEEVGDAPTERIESVVEQSEEALERLLKTARSGHFLRAGMKVAIVGKPNAGKSSLLNQLLSYDRAIVTEIAGTTRDALQEPLDLNGIPVILIDTAGIRHTEDTVEKIGIERSAMAVEEADFILMLFEANTAWSQEDSRVRTLIGKKPFVLIANKVDLSPGFNFDEFLNGKQAEDSEAGEPVAKLEISAKTGEGVKNISSVIENYVLTEEALKQAGGSLNQRQYELCNSAHQALRLVKETLAEGLPQDCLATDLKLAVDRLSEVCGESVSEEVIAQVFANFCIGK